MSDDRYDNRYYNEDTFSIQSTAGAVPVKNHKGEISMKKVKVQRYVSGKRPDYAHGEGNEQNSDQDSQGEDEDFTTVKIKKDLHIQKDHSVVQSNVYQGDEEKEESVPDLNDPRIRRLLAAKMSGVRRVLEQNSDSDDEEDRLTRHRKIHEPEMLSDGDENRKGSDDSDDYSSGSDELDDEGISRRRELMRQRALMKAQIGEKEEIMDKEEEKSGQDEESDEEETTDSEEEEEEEGAKLKPVFVRKKNRLTVQDREGEVIKQKQIEREAQHMAALRKRQTLRMVEEDVRKSMQAQKITNNDPAGLNEINTDDENEEVEYEAWKLRELKRMKRDRDEREAAEKEQVELERIRGLTEQERREEAKKNPKVITNKPVKGKYKFMQKYYHRGAFFMENENNLYKRDCSTATLEDKFDKTVLPKVMQVKNFGRSGRTKYTHLVDQDTTEFESPWSHETMQNTKFHTSQSGGMKQQFDRPSNKKK